MISIAHAVTGSFIAATLPQPWLYVPLCLASHFMLDFVAHYDVGVAMKQYHFSKGQIIFWEALDLLGAVALIALIWRQTPSHFTPHLWFGALIAILPDIIEASDFFFHQPLTIFRPLYWFHERFHHSTKDIFWGLLPQAILVSIIAVAAMCNW